MRWFLFPFFAVLLITSIIIIHRLNNPLSANRKVAPGIERRTVDTRNETLIRLKRYAVNLKGNILKNNLSNRYCFMIDMGIASGSKRFFIFDLEKDSIVQAGLVTHGSGVNHSPNSIAYSNEPGSNCTSEGKYKIGKSYDGKFGLAYKLHGLDKSNSNAFNRFVVLHAHPCVPDNEIAPLKICMSWGCPTVSPAFLNQLKIYISQSEKPILLWIFK